MARRLLTTITVAVALSAAAGAPAAIARPAVDSVVRSASTPTTTHVTVTRPDGFPWLETLLGAGAGGGLVALGVASVGLRRRIASSPVRAIGN